MAHVLQKAKGTGALLKNSFALISVRRVDLRRKETLLFRGKISLHQGAVETLLGFAVGRTESVRSR
jgi:hypothetical protein